MVKLTGWLWAGGLAVALACCGGGESPSGATEGAGAGGSGGSTSGGGDGGSTSSSSGSGGTGGATAAPVLTAEVSPSTVVAGASVTVTVSITNFTFVAPMNQPNVDGEGHYHVYLDGATGGMYLANGQTPTKLVKIPAGTLPGAHTLRVSVSSNDHVPLDPPVEKILDITVQ